MNTYATSTTSEIVRDLNNLAEAMKVTANTEDEKEIRRCRKMLADMIVSPVALLGTTIDPARYAPNVYVYLIECLDHALRIRFGATAPTEVAPVVEPVVETPAEIAEGTYTVSDSHGNITVRVKKIVTGSLAGRTTIEYLYGPDNELNFRGFGFVRDDGTIAVWTRFLHTSINNRVPEIQTALQNVDSAEQAGQAYALRSGRCRRCGRKLTVEASINRGFGPDCITKV